MEDKKDMSYRVNYLRSQKQQQKERSNFYVGEILRIKELLEINEKEIIYNDGWIKFHEVGIEGHKKQIQEAFSLDEKKDQEQKLQFHIKQIEDHHKKTIEYHKKELNALRKEIQLFEEGIKRCEEQINYLNEKIKENTISS